MLDTIVSSLIGLVIVAAFLVLWHRDYFARLARAREEADAAYLARAQEADRLRKLARLHLD